jgi:predicted transcriptional regulator
MATDLSDRSLEVFYLLRKKGPLAVTQISCDLVMPLDDVRSALKDLRERRIVEPRSDGEQTEHYNVDLRPWGLATTFW